MAVVPDPVSVLALPAIFGDDASSLMPASWDVVLFDGDPRGSGSELAAVGGYARASAANTSAVWDLSTNPGMAVTVVTFAESTAAWSDTAYFSALVDPANDGVWWFPQELADPIVVTEAGVTPVVRFRAVFANPANYL